MTEYEWPNSIRGWSSITLYTVRQVRATATKEIYRQPGVLGAVTYFNQIRCVYCRIIIQSVCLFCFVLFLYLYDESSWHNFQIFWNMIGWIVKFRSCFQSADVSEIAKRWFSRNSFIKATNWGAKLHKICKRTSDFYTNCCVADQSANLLTKLRT